MREFLFSILHSQFSISNGIWRLRPLLSWKRMASLGQTAVQSKQRTHLELSTRRSETFMHLLGQRSSHFMQLMHLSGSMAMCISVCECTHPKAVPIGQTDVQKTLPHFQAEKRMASSTTIPQAKPAATETPMACHVFSVSAVRTIEAALQRMFQGSMT